jgi:thiol-disulfide isomerase/thioredoxin
VLWLEGRVAQPSRDGSIVLDAAGGVVEFDRRLRPRQLVLRSEGREWLSASAAPHDGLWLTDATGALLRADRGGVLRAAPPTGLHYPAVVSDASTGAAWITRSSQRFAYVFDTAESPVILRADTVGSVVLAIGRAVRPAHVLLEDLANAGHLVVSANAVFYAPFIRDELVAMTTTGDTLWVASRGLPQSTPEPRFALERGRAVVDYSPVNLGLTLGPDGRLYLLSTPSRTTAESRLDVFDPATGALLRSAHLNTALPTLAADDKGRVYILDPFRLLAGVPPRERQPAPPFDLPALDGGRISLDTLRGKVALLNLWASWCDPCREEMPALDSLRREVSDSAFTFVGLNDDVDVAAARRFLRERGFAFPVALGTGGLRERFHAPGLPVTLLIDRDGREVRRWIGYAGSAQLASIRALVRAELDRPASTQGTHGSAHHHGN